MSERAPLLGNKVPVRCAGCRARIDRMEFLLRGWTLYHGLDSAGPNSGRWGDSPGGLAYRCKCGTTHPVDVRALETAAPAAWELGRDLFLGAPRFGLPGE